MELVSNAVRRTVRLRVAGETPRRSRNAERRPREWLTPAEVEQLANDSFDPGWGTEVGYSFHPAVWGRGYASELVTACLDIADHVLKLPAVMAFTKPETGTRDRSLRKPASQ